MSRSEYKAKVSRQRSRSAKPYERNNSTIVDRVKSWLAPSSWLSYLSPSKEDTGGRHSRRNDEINSTLQPNHLNFRAPQATIDTSHLPHQQQTQLFTTAPPNSSISTEPLHQSTEQSRTTDQVPTFAGGPSSAFKPSQNHRRLNTADLRETLSMFEDVLGDNREKANVSNSSSNESWVAEDDEQGTPEVPKEPTATMQSPSEQHMAVDQGPTGSVSRVLPNTEAQETQEYTVQRLTDPVFPASKGPTRSSGQKVTLSHKMTSGLSPDLSRRLYSSSAVGTSTPQLSPVREEEDHSVDRGSSPFQPVLPLPAISFTGDQRMDTTADPVTHARTYTSESISRSPFRSPFYSGRTSFGGAASHNRMRVKRPRTESSPPVLAPLRVSVKATPKPGSSHSVVSHTAKRIMDTLNSLTSPLSDARKMPLRGVPPEMQQAKRRRVSETNPSILSPPPVDPMQKVRVNTPQIVPSERSSSRKSLIPTSASMDQTDSSRPTLSTLTPTNSPPKVINSKLNLLTTHQKPSSVLSGLTFSAPPIERLPSPEQGATKQPMLSGPSPKAPRMKSHHMGGKMSRRSQASRNRRASVSEEDEEDYVNPIAPPPQVALSLGQGSSLPSFTFHSQLLTEKSPPSSKLPAATPPKLKPLTHQLGASPSYSFAPPTPKAAEPAIPAAPNPTLHFGFSAPKPHSMSTAATSSTTSQPTASISKSSPRPLKNMSVVEALKKPEYSQFLPLTNKTKAPTESKTTDVVDLTVSDEDESPVKSHSKTILSGGIQLGPAKGLQLGGQGLKLPNAPFPQLGQAAGSWECDTCLVSNKSSDDKCVACTTPKPSSKTASKPPPNANDYTSLKESTAFPGIIAPPSDSWTCDTCLITNKVQNNKCAACTTPKPGAANKTGTLSLSGAGGFKLGAGVSLGGLTTGLSSTGGITLGTSSQLKPLPAFAPAAKGSSWECDVCMVVNKPETTLCVACTAAKPGASQAKTSATLTFGATGGLKIGGAALNMLKKPASADQQPLKSTGETSDSNSSTTKEDTSKASGLQFGSTGGLTLGSAGGLKLGAGITLGSLSATSSSTPLGSTTTTTDAPFKPTIQFGVPLGTTSGGGLKLSGGSLSFGAKPATDSPLTGIKLGGDVKTGSSGPIGGITLSTLNTSKPLLIGGNTSSTTVSTSANPLSGLQFGSTQTSSSGVLGGGLTSTNPVARGGTAAATTANPLTGIKLGGPLTTNSPLTNIKLGGELSTSTGSPLKIGQTTGSSLGGIKLGGIGTTSSSTPLTGIKLGGAASVPASNSPLTEITLGGTASALTSNSPLTGIKLGGTTSTSAPVNPLAGIKFGGGLTTTTSSAGSTLSTGGLQSQGASVPQFSLGSTASFSFTGAQKTDTPTPTLQITGATPSIFGSNPPGTAASTGFSVTPGFGGQPNQTLSLSTPAGDSNQAEMQSPDNEMNVEQDKPTLMFGQTAQQPSLPSNIFGGQNNQPQAQAPFAFNQGTTKPSFNFGGSSSTSNFTFGGSSQPQASGPTGPSQTMFTATQQNAQPGFNFSTGSGINLNFGGSTPQQQVGNQNMFSASPAAPSTPAGRVIKKARRRKA